jgi:large subunit ribosomal protein L22
MEARARLRYIRSSPRKMRIVADQVRGKSVAQAFNLLHYLPQKAATPIEKTIKSAVANLYDQAEGQVEEDALFVSQIFVDEAPFFKRFRPISRGRAHRIKKRNSHLTVVVAQRVEAGETEEELAA